VLKLVNILKDILLEEKKKRDRCLRIADRKYDKPSAYKSGAVVKCRQGKIWKDLKEDIDPKEAYDNIDAIETIIDNKRNVAFLGKIKDEEIKQVNNLISFNKLKKIPVKGNKDAIIVYKTGSEKEANRLNDIAGKYGGLLSYKATKDESIEIGRILGYDEKSIQKYIQKNYYDNGTLIPQDLRKPITEEESLHKWFSRQGGSGKSKGWVDCNTCRTDSSTGKKKCKACGRQKGEKRSKYPSCRPTPSQCSTPGKGKTWGKTK
jgi:hypothetical protein